MVIVMASMIALLADMAPDAIGLCFFEGCFLSAGASITSFMIYETDESAQNIINAKIDLAKRSRSKSFPEKIIAAKTTMFLTHW